MRDGDFKIDDGSVVAGHPDDSFALAAFATLVVRLTRDTATVWTLTRNRDVPAARRLVRLVLPADPAMPFNRFARAVADAYARAEPGNVPDPNDPGFCFLENDPPAIVDGLGLWQPCLAVTDSGVIAVPATTGPTDQARARSFRDAFMLVLHQVRADPSIPLRSLRLADFFHHAPEWPRAKPAPTGGLSHGPADLAALFAIVLRSGPHRPAIRWVGGVVTFAELDAAAGEIAGSIQAMGIQAGGVIAYRLARETDGRGRVLYLATQLAAYRIGCAVLPLGQQCPPAMARQIMDTVAAQALLDGAGDGDVTPAWMRVWPGARLALCPDARWFIAGPDAPPAAAMPAGTAIVLTTSGSTGTPKVIRLSHAMLVGFLAGLTDTAIMPVAPWLMGPNIGFDQAIADVWMAWNQGQPVVLVATERRTPTVIREARALGAQIISLSPSVAAALVRSDPACLVGLSVLELVGETLPAPLVGQLQAISPTTRIVNGYGPSEMAILTTAWVSDGPAPDHIPIGRVLPGYSALVADPLTLDPMPRYWPGELLIACPVPALGYHDDARTAERFITAPDGSARSVYRSGDLAWVDAENWLRYGGRADRQVKLRGVRIELDGIERVIGAVPGVGDAMALVIGRDMAARIVAVVTPDATRPSAEALIAAVLSACRSWLPRAAVPSRILVRVHMPLGMSDKLDREAIAAEISSTPTAVAETAPVVWRCPIEERIAAIWREVLALTHDSSAVIRPDDDVHDLGVTSLDLMAIAEQISSALGVPITEQELAEYPTIRAQADLLTARGQRLPGKPSPSSPFVGITVRLTRPDSGDGYILCVPGAGGGGSRSERWLSAGLGRFGLGYLLADLQGHRITDLAVWRDTLPAIAEMIVSGRMPRPRALVGFSAGGWVAWVIDRLCVGGGLPPIPIINLDGGAVQAVDPASASHLAAILPAPSSIPPARMLLIHCARAGRFLSQSRDIVREWTWPGLCARTVDVHGLLHRDVLADAVFQACEQTIVRFIDDTLDDRPIAVASPGVSGDMYRALVAPEPPSPARARQLVDALIDASGDRGEYAGLAAALFLAMASGDATLALTFVRRLTRLHPNQRDIAYAEVAMLAELGRGEEAIQAANDWMQGHSGDQSLLARARRRTGPLGAWTDPTSLVIGRRTGTDFAAGMLG